MREWCAVLGLSLVICAGCTGGKVSSGKPAPVYDEAAVGGPFPTQSKPEPKRGSNQPAELIVTPGNSLTGKVVRYNEAGRFVVLDFPLGRTPPLEQRLFVYRSGLKVGEIKITGPQIENHIVADLTTGEAQPGDEVRNR
jgi:hypothetical protein